MKIFTKKNILIFLAGMVTMLILNTILNWEEAKRSFEEGVKAAQKHNNYSE